MILVGTSGGCLAFDRFGEQRIELPGQAVNVLVAEKDGTCLAVINGREIWRRDSLGRWSVLAATEIPLQSLAVRKGIIFAGASDEAAVLRIREDGRAERVEGFDRVQGREEWFAGGPPLGVRFLTTNADDSVLLAAVHVGGIPRSVDGGETWTPTIPIMFDVHQVCSHPSIKDLVAAATAVGLCVSQDGGQNWSVMAKGLDITNSLAVAILDEDVLFSIQDGPFAKRSQIWRWQLGDDRVEQLQHGLPLWLTGKVDTAHIAAAQGRAAILDGGGHLWLSESGSRDWHCIGSGLPFAFCIAMVGF